MNVCLLRQPAVRRSVAQRDRAVLGYDANLLEIHRMLELDMVPFDALLLCFVFAFEFFNSKKSTKS